MNRQQLQGQAVWLLYYIGETALEIAEIKDRRKKHTPILFDLRAPAIGLRKDCCEKFCNPERGTVNSLCGIIGVMAHRLIRSEKEMRKCACIENPLSASLDVHCSFFSIS